MFAETILKAMYEYLNGEIAEITPTAVIIDVGGIGYYVYISLQTFSALNGRQQTKLYIHPIFREDARILYGFAGKAERELFRLLIGVSGIGGNTARMILSSYSPEDLHTILSTGKSELLSSVKGIGAKTAQRVIVELRDKILTVALPSENTAQVASPSAFVAQSETFSEALSALLMLGFAKPASEKALKQLLEKDPQAPVEELIRMALKSL